MSLSKRMLEDLERRDPLEDPYYGEPWPSAEELERDAQVERDEA